MAKGPKDREHVQRPEGEGPIHKQMDRRQFLKAAGLTGPPSAPGRCSEASRTLRRSGGPGG